MKIVSDRIVQLDGLRGVAIASVLLFHLSIMAPATSHALDHLLWFGWSGVDLFFVLSGFLIGGILMDNRDRENYFGAFYARRFFRIIPVYFLIVGVYFALYAMGGTLRSTLVNSICPPMPWYSYFSFTTNVWIARHDSMAVFASPTWSLAIEEQFYLTLPLLIRLIKPKYVPVLVGSLVVGIAGTRFALCLGNHITQLQAYVLPCFHADGLMIGVGCAWAYRQQRIVTWLQTRPWVLYVAVATFGAAIWSTGATLNPDPSARVNTYGLTVVACFYAALLMISVLLPASPITLALRIRPLRSLGKLAYCIYLLHVSALLGAFDLLPDSGPLASTPVKWAAGLASIGAVIFVAGISWRSLESPLIRIGHRFKYASRTIESPVQDVLPLTS